VLLPVPCQACGLHILLCAPSCTMSGMWSSYTTVYSFLYHVRHVVFIYYCVLLPVPCQACGLHLPQLVPCNIQQSCLNLDSSALLANIGNHTWTHAGQGYHCRYSATVALTLPLQNLHTKSIFVYSSWESSVFSYLSQGELTALVAISCTAGVLMIMWKHPHLRGSPMLQLLLPQQMLRNGPMYKCHFWLTITSGIRFCNTDL